MRHMGKNKKHISIPHTELDESLDLLYVVNAPIIMATLY